MQEPTDLIRWLAYFVHEDTAGYQPRFIHDGAFLETSPCSVFDWLNQQRDEPWRLASDEVALLRRWGLMP